jgi:hypothetical protein
MATTKSIDERIREKARADLKKDIGERFKRAYEALMGAGALSTGVKKHDGSDCTAWGCLEAAEEAIFNYLVQKVEEKAVAEFLTKIDSLQDQVDSLAQDYRG